MPILDITSFSSNILEVDSNTYLKSFCGLMSSFVSHKRTRIIKMLIIIAVLFSFAWLPYYVLFVGAVSFLYLLLSSFYTGFIVAHDSCVTTKVNVSKHCTRTMKISDINNLVLVHVINNTRCSYTSSTTHGARTRHQQHMVLVHVINNTWCSYTSSTTLGARTRHQQHSVLVHVINNTWCSYTSSTTLGARTRHQQHSVLVHVINNTWCSYTSSTTLDLQLNICFTVQAVQATMF